MTRSLRIFVLVLFAAPFARADSTCTGPSGACDAGVPAADVHVSTQVLKFKSETTHGQVLSSGQKPPATTLQESQKELTPGTTDAVRPARMP